LTEKNKMPFLQYKGICSLDLGLYIKKGGKGSYNGALRSVDFEKVPGRSGDLIMDNKRYDNITVSYDFILLEKDIRDFNEITHRVKKWLLADVGYFMLWDSYDMHHYRMGMYSGSVDISEELRGMGEFSASFNCKPFKYSFGGTERVVMTTPGDIVNPEYIPSMPYIKIYGAGNVTLFVNNDSFYFYGVDGYIEIDSEAMNAYKGITSLNNAMKTPKFPEFMPGTNTISWEGQVEKIEIIPRWCAL